MVTAKKNKGGRPSMGERKNFVTRLPVEVVEDFDAIAREFGLSRNQLLTRITQNLVDERKRGGGELLEPWSESLDVVLERVLREVIRDERGPVSARLAKSASKRRKG